MYEVVTVITPIGYATRFNKAVDRLNDDHATDYTNLDVQVLQVLEEANRGMRNKTIMLAVRNRIYMERFQASLNRLIGHECIVKKRLGKAVLYSITIKGRMVLVELNNILPAIVEENMKRYAG